MKERLSAGWQKVPRHVRRPIVLTLGMFCVLLSGAIGWLPGPGGIPLFLLGIAILASEFHWAKQLKRFILDMVYRVGRWIRTHTIASIVIVISGAALGCFILYMLLQTK